MIDKGEWLDEPKLPALRSDLDKSLDMLSKKQQRFLRAWAEHSFVANHAIAALENSGQWAPHRRTIARWKQNPDFVRAVDTWKALVLEMAGVDAASVVARVNDLALYNSEKITDEGKVRMRDANASLAALRLLMPYVGLADKGRNDDLPSVPSFQIIVNNSDRKTAIEVDPDRPERAVIDLNPKGGHHET